jgi:hypothetical protein
MSSTALHPAERIKWTDQERSTLDRKYIHLKPIHALMLAARTHDWETWSIILQKDYKAVAEFAVVNPDLEWGVRFAYVT